MRSTLRIVTVLMGAGFALQGVGWLVVPGRAAASLGMPVLDGLVCPTYTCHPRVALTRRRSAASIAAWPRWRTPFGCSISSKPTA